MVTDEKRLSRWTRRFTVASASSLVLVQLLALLSSDRHLMAVVAVFGFICPMIFGMAYLLLPSFAGRTLVHQWIPGIHFVLAYTGTAAMVGDRFLGLDGSLLKVGIALWSLGVAIFLGELLWTVAPAISDQPSRSVGPGSRSPGSTRLAMGMIPVALGYLLLGTIALLGRAKFVPVPLPTAVANILHYYAAGFGALLIFAIGARMMPGFFRVELPNRLVTVVLIAGAIGPALLGTYFLRGAWFRVGALLEGMAMVGYAMLVVSVYRQTDRLRPGIYGILLGAVAGVVAVGLGLSVVVGGGYPGAVTAHVELILTGFFALTVVGYVYQFYPVTTGPYVGASPWTALASIAAIATGTFLQLADPLSPQLPIGLTGAAIALFGTLVYWYLVVRRTLPS